ncbi:MAG: hypothetical protein N2169_07635 [bacterium]|nr:hypothetical protein [bacterium]
MLRILIVSDNYKVHPIVNEIEALGNEVVLLNDVALLKDTLLKNDFDLILIDYEKTFRLSSEEVYELRYFSQNQNEVPIVALVDDLNTKSSDVIKRGYSGIFPYNHSVNMLNEFMSHFQTLAF